MKKFLSAFVSVCMFVCLAFNVFSENKESTAETQVQNIQDGSSSVQTTTEAPLPAVSGFKVSSADEKSITLSWDEYDGASSYTISMYDEKTKKYAEAAMTKDTSCKIGSLSSAKAYTFIISALLVGDEVKYTPDSQPLYAVTAAKRVEKVWTNDIEKSSITLSWKKADGAAKYEIWMYDSEKDKFILCGNTAETQYTVKSLEENTVYTFKVRAVTTSKNAMAYSKFSNIYSDFTDKNGDPVTKAQAAKYYNGVINSLKNEKNITVSHKKSINAYALSCSNRSILRTVKNIVSLFNGEKNETVTFTGGTSAEGSVDGFIQPYSKQAQLRGYDILKFSVSEKDGVKRIKIVLKEDKSGSAHNGRAVIGARISKVSTAPIVVKKLSQNYGGSELTLLCKDGRFQKLHIGCAAVVTAKCKVSTVGFETQVGYGMEETFTLR